MVMLLGQYSTGKTTFIKHLLKNSYPGELLFSCSFPPGAAVENLLSCLLFSSFWTGAHIGPEPTTDRFVVVMVFSEPLVITLSQVESFVILHNFDYRRPFKFPCRALEEMKPNTLLGVSYKIGLEIKFLMEWFLAWSANLTSFLFFSETSCYLLSLNACLIF